MRCCTRRLVGAWPAMSDAKHGMWAMDSLLCVTLRTWQAMSLQTLFWAGPRVATSFFLL